MNPSDKLLPIHPGEILLEEFLHPKGISQNQLALAIRVPARRINEIVLGKRRITADTALRLGRYFKMSATFWLASPNNLVVIAEKDCPNKFAFLPKNDYHQGGGKELWATHYC